MTWSYTDPSASDKDAVRYLVGDTDTNDQQTSDEEIAWALTEYPKVKYAAALVCRALAAKYASCAVGVRVGDVQISNAAAVSKEYAARAKDLDPNGLTKSTAIVLPKFGGLSISEKQTLSEDADAVQPAFSRAMNDIPGGPSDGVTNESDADDPDWIW